MEHEDCFRGSIEYILRLKTLAKRENLSLSSLCLLPPLYYAGARGIEKVNLHEFTLDRAAHTNMKRIEDLISADLAIYEKNPRDRRSELVIITQNGESLYESIRKDLYLRTKPLDFYVQFFNE
jgi:DNA-binding MarR family transcriptional regulator